MNWSEHESHSVVSSSLQPHVLYSPWDSPGLKTGVGSLSLLQGNLPNPGIKPALWADSLPAEPQGKLKNTGVGSLSLLQQIFPTQELNRGLLHGRRILYLLSCQGSLIWTEISTNFVSTTQYQLGSSVSCPIVPVICAIVLLSSCENKWVFLLPS